MQALAKPSVPGKTATLIGGIGCPIWIAGAVLSAFGDPAGGVGMLLVGIGAMFACFGAIGIWQSEKLSVAMIDGVLGLVGGILLLIGGILRIPVGSRSAGGYVCAAGYVLFGVSLLILGLLLWKLQSKFPTESALKIDLAIPAVMLILVAACTSLVGLMVPTIPGALMCMILFFLKK